MKAQKQFASIFTCIPHHVIFARFMCYVDWYFTFMPYLFFLPVLQAFDRIKVVVVILKIIEME